MTLTNEFLNNKAIQTADIKTDSQHALGVTGNYVANNLSFLSLIFKQPCQHRQALTTCHLVIGEVVKLKNSKEIFRLSG
ncbi:CLUMA_CG007378, isoform A [Clunio marinus]|uniref:CLUMA_CG007378, isoform A n=1 Tax=Clunio marinus TaxID=568069 RepID=A0A1J1I0X2_9DIPT|nr:CLUMA_CG007378, isoform A [Clunio marinus]